MPYKSKEDRIENNKLYRLTHREQRRKWALDYYYRHREEQRRKRHESYLKNKERDLAKAKLYYYSNHEKSLAIRAEIRKRYKLRAIAYYGGGIAKCVKCGFEDIRALSIDHIAGDGAEHRRRDRRNIYCALFKDRWPEGYQTLCFNCQRIKQTEEGENRWKNRSAEVENGNTFV